MIKENTQTRTFETTRNILYQTGNFLTYASFFGVVALAADRFLAVHLHLRYQELVTHKRVVAVVISIWIISAILMLLFIWTRPSNISAIISVTVQSVCYLSTALFYFKIYLAVRHHTNQMHVLQAQLAQNNEVDIANAARQRKAAVGTSYVYLLFWFVTCQTHVAGLSIEAMDQVRCYCSLDVILPRWCSSIHRSTLWSTPGRWGMFGMLSWKYWET